ncbi:nucleotide exchange factor GrpE [Aureliella helgolandensis]|nr:nucleotide exchange factor GrpE [Aureliella helgolandensis]
MARDSNPLHALENSLEMTQEDQNMNSESRPQADDQSDDASQAFADALDQALEQSPEEAPAAAELTVDERVLEAEREVLRSKAELENFRKRMQRDSEQQLKYANTALIRDLLEAIDNLDRAIGAAQEDAANPQSLLEGVKLVRQQFTTALAKHGCTVIDGVGSQFDPNVHEAISQMPSEQYAAGTVAQEVAVGYKLHDRVVRPSSVIVSTGTAG